MSTEGVCTDPKTLEAIASYQRPTDVETLQSFLGLTSYCHRYTPNFTKVAGPLHALTGKGALVDWGPQSQRAFEELKKLLISAPVLAFPDFEQPFILETDASGELGWVRCWLRRDQTASPVS